MRLRQKEKLKYFINKLKYLTSKFCNAGSFRAIKESLNWSRLNNSELK